MMGSDITGDITLGKTAQKELEALGVSTVYVFGSYAEEKATPRSDVDLGILFNTPTRDSDDTREVYNTLFQLFTHALRRENLDIVLLDRATLELKHDVISYGKVIFETSPERRLAFEERTLLLYADFNPILKAMDEAVLKRI